MGGCFSASRGSEDAKMELPFPDRLDFPILQRCFEVGGPSSPPKDIKYVLLESVVLVSRDDVVPTVPVEPLRVEELQEMDQEDDELSSYEQGYYHDDFLTGPVPDEFGGKSEEEEMLEIDPVQDMDVIESDPEEEDPIEDDSKEEDPIEDDFEEDPEIDHDGQYLEFDSEFVPAPGLIPLLTYLLMIDDDWKRLYTVYGIRRRSKAAIGSESPKPCDPGSSRVRSPSP